MGYFPYNAGFIRSEHGQEIMSATPEKKEFRPRWNWWNRPEPQPADAAKKERASSLRESAVMLTAGLIMFFALHWRQMGTIAMCLAAVVFTTGHFIPPAYRAINNFVRLSARAVGICTTWLTLVPFFYLCFLPGRLILLLRGKDPMCRKFPGAEPSYWVARPPQKPDHFRRQF